MASIDLIPGFESFNVNEAKLSTVHRAAKKGSYPAVIVVVQDGKVIHQEPVSTPDVAPATFNVMQEKYPKALLHLEDKTGKRLFSESVDEAEDTIGSLNKMANTDLERIADYADMIKDRMSQGQTLDAWMYSKISDSVKNLNSVHDTMDGNDGVNEAKMSKEKIENLIYSLENEKDSWHPSSDSKKKAMLDKLKKDLSKFESVVTEAKDMTFADYLEVLDVKFKDAMAAVKGENGSDAEIKPTRGDILQNFTLFRNYVSSLTKKYKGDKTKLRFLKECVNEYNGIINESVVTEGKDRMIKQIERALKDGTSIFKLPMATQNYYNKNKSDFENVDEATITERKMPTKYIGNDEIVFLKTKETSAGAHYNLYYKGHDIDLGGQSFKSEKDLKKFADDYILSNQWYNKLKHEDSKPLPEFNRPDQKIGNYNTSLDGNAASQ